MSSVTTAPASGASGFRELGVSEPVLAASSDVGYEAPSPIQAATIPVLLSGADMLGQAQTGTGRTAAIALPILTRIDLARRRPQARERNMLRAIERATRRPFEPMELPTTADVNERRVARFMQRITAALEAGIDGRLIGRVDIRDDHSYVALPQGMPKEIFRKLEKTRVAGQPLQLSRVRSVPPRPPRKAPRKPPRNR